MNLFLKLRVLIHRVSYQNLKLNGFLKSLLILLVHQDIMLKLSEYLACLYEFPA